MSSLPLNSLAAPSACGFKSSSPSVDMLSLIYSIVCDTSLLSTLTLNTFTCNSPPLTSPAVTLHHLSSLCFCVKESKVIRTTTRPQQTTLPFGSWGQHDMPTDTQAHSHCYYCTIILLLLKMQPKKPSVSHSLSLLISLFLFLPHASISEDWSPFGLPPLGCACPCPAVETLLTGLRETVGGFQARQTDRDRSE